MSPTFGMHKLVYLAALTVLIDNYVNRKSEEKLDFLEKTAAWLTQNITMFRQQSNAKCTKRKKQMDEEEEKEGVRSVQTIANTPKPTCDENDTGV